MKTTTQNILAKLSCLLLVLLMVPGLVLVGAAQETGTEPVCYEHGDINGDNSVDSRDAIYTLYHVLHHDTGAGYPVNQDCDFDGDGDVDSSDAIYVLYGSMGIFDGYELCGTVHRYYEPRWTWNPDFTEATVEFVCGCGESHSFDMENGVTISTDSSEATCTAAGKAEFTASVTFEGKEYTSVQSRTTAPAGHQMTGVQSCTESSVCDVCGFTLEPLDHSWVLLEEVEATCQTQGHLSYECQRENCGETLTVTPEGLANHSFTVSLEEVHVEGCQYRKQYQCAHCDATADGEVFYKHVYTALLTTEASCSADGVMTYTCSCGDSYEASVSDPDAHSWVAGETDENGVTAYTCSACGATKTALCQEGNEATVSSAALKESELQLNGAIVVLDNATADALSEEVTISVTTAAAEDLSLSEEQAAQIGDNPVYDFSMTSGQEQVSEFAGEVTVSIPYTLQEGDDAECIDVWFIADDGTVTCVQGTYSAGFVTFTTDHFSYYTVTRLTAAQRCAFYGHVMVEHRQDATCTQAGHYVNSCKRCGLVETDEILEKLSHNYETAAEGNVPATCMTPGSYAKICTVCKQSFTGDVPATGHSFVLDKSQTVDATCTQAGREVYVCEHNCGEQFSLELSALDHQFGEDVTTKPSCTTIGATARTCLRCGETITAEELAPLGHNYYIGGWNWDTDYSSANVTLVCANDPSHTVTLEAVLRSSVEAPNCTGTGKKTYTAVASYNLATYEDTAEEELAEAGHTTGDTWVTGEHQHYKQCSVCGEKVDTAAHAWGTAETLKAADCTNSGLIRQTCGVCGYTQETTVPASGQHSFAEGTCSICGFADDSCDHIRMYAEDLDLSGYDICEGNVITLRHCDCGQVNYLIHQLNCNFDYENVIRTEQTLPDGTTYTLEKNICSDCGFVWENAWYEKLDRDTCTSNWISYNRFSLDGELIAETESVEEEGSGQHFTSFKQSSVDMTTLGMCGGEIVTYTCYCGERTSTHMENYECVWDYDSENSNDTKRIYTCMKCDTVRTMISSRSKPDANCYTEYSSTTVLTRGSQEIYRFSYTDKYIEHNYSVTDVTMYGKTCLDGVMIDHVCLNCGEEYRFYSDYHVQLQNAVYALADYGLCGGVMTQTECPCGQTREFYRISDGERCEYLYVDTNSLGFERYACEQCGGYYLEKETSPKDDNCTVNRRVIRNQYSPEGKLIVTFNTLWPYTEHEYRYTWEMKGSSCEDGVKLHGVCKDCGFARSYNTSGHADLILQEYDLADYGMCGGTFQVDGCPCGDYSSYSYDDRCSWNYHHDDAQGNSVYICDDCGTYKTSVQGKLENIGNCRYQTPYILTFTRDGKTVLEINYQETEISHRNVWKLTLDNGAKDCEDGYTAVGTCQACGHTEKIYGSGHGTWTTARKTISTTQLCGELDQVTYSCACGEYHGQQDEWFGGECFFDEEYDDEAGLFHATCSGCGVTRTRKYSETDVVDCSFTQTNTYTYQKNASTLFSYANTEIHKSHTYVYRYEMEGNSCEDGYYAYGTCAYCDKERSRIYRDSCSSRLTGLEILYEGSDVCGPIALETYDCPCGDRYYQQISHHCSMEHLYWDDILDRSFYRCSECGTGMSCQDSSVSVSGTCDETVTLHYIFEQNGSEILNLNRQYTRKNHRFVYDIELDGADCDDGFTASGSCYYCGKTESYSSGGHESPCVEYYDLSEYGLCGGSIEFHSCGCGEEAHWYTDIECDWDSTGNTNADGQEEFYCSQCQTYRYSSSQEEIDRESCRFSDIRRNIFVRNGEILLDLTFTVRYRTHTMVVESFEMNGETCEDGYEVNLACHYCGETTREGWRGHNLFVTEVTDLGEEAPDSCGGIITYLRCACGQNTGVDYDRIGCTSTAFDSWSEEDENGITHWYESNTCKDCGMNWLWERYDIPEPENCINSSYNHYTFSQDNGFILNLDACQVDEEYHIYSPTAVTLKNGSQSCLDGILITYTCCTCGDSYDSHAAHHEMIVTDSIDLSQYGSVCGGSLNHYSCACGERQQYDLGKDLKCDMGRYSTPVWIPGYVHDYQYTTEDYTITYSDAWIMTCAVTDPACPMQIRMAEYWLVEDCIATEYQTWQLGYDSDTSTWEQEITIPTGYDTHAYHNYNRTSINETLADGTTVSGILDSCPDCGSTYSHKDFYNSNGNQLKEESEATNTLGNHEKKYWYGIYEYGLEANGYRYLTLQRNEYTYADSSEYWYQYEFTYDFTGQCKRTEVYTNSNGERNVHTGTGHVTYWDYETLQNRTCTQHYVYTEQLKCYVCDYAGKPYTYREDPNDHCWSGNDEDGYVCTACGMENANGASGSIVLEDMSTPDSYVVGYWNRGEIQFHTYVSVVMEGSDENEEILDVPYSACSEENVVGYTMNKSDAQSAARTALEELGYSGSYALRFTFVPVNAADELDYAITFDSLSTIPQ